MKFLAVLFPLLVSIGAYSADYSFEALTKKTISDGTKLSEKAIKSINTVLKSNIERIEGQDFSTHEAVEVYYNCIETPNGLFCLVGIVSEGGLSAEFAAKLKMVNGKAISFTRINL